MKYRWSNYVSKLPYSLVFSVFFYLDAHNSLRPQVTCWERWHAVHALLHATCSLRCLLRFGWLWRLKYTRQTGRWVGVLECICLCVRS